MTSSTTIPSTIAEHAKCDGDLYAYDKGQVRCQHRDATYAIPVDHDCWDFAEHYTTDGPLGDAYDCGRCGAFLQVG
jgi:hypothetical protein